MIFAPLATDEAEHLHFAYLTFLGYRPYVDFWQHHMPLSWYLLHPIFTISTPLTIFVVERFVTLALVSSGILLVTSNFSKEERIWAALLALSTFIFPYERASLRYGNIRFALIAWLVLSLEKRSLYTTLCFRFSHAGHSPKPFSNDHASGLPFRAVFVAYFMKDNFRNPKIFWAIPITTASSAAFFLISFTPSDILFFVFHQTSEFHNGGTSLYRSYMFLFLCYCRFSICMFSKTGASGC